ncbi:SdpI family protein [Cohnella hongkongensis]|uniref:SdpI family protein n=1 Tax=Cohnella hongkongensis TaxID=178337 RepID=A0ABV9FI18_9BACL
MTNADHNEQEPSVWSRSDWILLAANIAIFTAVFLIFNDRLPDIVASHYNLRGEADRTMTKSSFWLMNAGLTIVLPSVMSIIRYIDPRKRNYARFQNYYNLIRWAINLFLHSVLLLVVLDNIGYKLPMLNLVIGGMGILWMIMGNRMGQMRSNFLFGIRTPWTLVDENNWRKTHRLGGRLWFAAGVIMFLSAWLTPSGWTVAILLVCTLASSLAPVLYSYMLFKQSPQT